MDNLVFKCNHCDTCIQVKSLYLAVIQYAWEEIDEKLYCPDCLEKLAKISICYKYNIKSA